jgi:hypothetical protein
MTHDVATVLGTLKRVLANGPLEHMPQRESDLEVLLALAAARLEPGRRYTEGELNDALAQWLETFASRDGVDHVTLRRGLVDARLLRRDKAGTFYEASEKADRALAAIEPARILADVRAEREERKRRHAA